MAVTTAESEEDMTRKEFESIAGVGVDVITYNQIIEPMYLASGLDKYDFIKYIDKSIFEKKKIKVDLPIGEIEGEPMTLYYIYNCAEIVKHSDPNNPVTKNTVDEVTHKLYEALDDEGFFDSVGLSRK